MSPLQRDVKAALMEASRPLFEELALKPGDVIPLRSRSHPEHTYHVLILPEGLAVHMDEGCEGEPFNGPLACWHSKQPQRYVMTSRAVTPYQDAASPVAIAFNDEQLGVIKSTIAKGVSDTELQLFVATCKRTGLDPFMKQIYAVMRWDGRAKREVMGIQVGIDGLRLIAERTGKYAGMDPIEWLDVDGQWAEVWTGVGEFPIAARTAVYRKDFERKVPAVARWNSYAQYFGNPSRLGAMWEKMPDVMIGKCAESLAMRRAFPAEMSGLASVIDSEYDPALEVEELQRAAPEAERRYVIEGQVVEQQSSTPEQRRAVSAAWGRASESRRDEARKLWPSAFQKPGPGVMNQLARLTQQDADEVLAFFQDVTPVEESTASEQNSPPSSPPANVGEGLEDPEDLPRDEGQAQAGDGDNGGATKAPMKRTPTQLLTAIGKKHGNGRALAARAIMPLHFGTMDPSKLTTEAAADYAALLEVWLNDPDHEHEAKYTADGRAVCGRCGIEMKEPEAAVT